MSVEIGSDLTSLRSAGEDETLWSVTQFSKTRKRREDILLLGELLELLTFSTKCVLELRVLVTEEVPSLASFLSNEILHLSTSDLKSLQDLLSTVLSTRSGLLNVVPGRSDEFLSLLSVSLDERFELIETLIDSVRTSGDSSSVGLCDRFGEFDRFFTGRSVLHQLVLCVGSSISD